MSTLPESITERLQREVLAELEDDYVGVWEIAHLAEEELGTTDPGEIQELVREVVSNMLMHGWIEPGYATDEGGFEPWPEEAPGRTALKISEELEALGRRPALGDVVWFNLTSYGEKVAAQS